MTSSTAHRTVLPRKEKGKLRSVRTRADHDGHRRTHGKLKTCVPNYREQCDMVSNTCALSCTIKRPFFHDVVILLVRIPLVLAMLQTMQVGKQIDELWRNSTTRVTKFTVSTLVAAHAVYHSQTPSSRLFRSEIPDVADALHSVTHGKS